MSVRSCKAPRGQTRDSDAKTVYLAGTGRNGSTVLGMLLGQQPDVFFGGELTHIWRRGYLENQLCGCGKPFLQCEFWQAVSMECFGESVPKHLADTLRLRDRISRFRNLPLARLKWGPSTADVECYAAIVERLLDAIRRVSRCRVIIDSSKYPTDLAALLRGGQDLCVLHLVRDCRAVMHSWKQRKRRPEIHWKHEDMPRYGAIQTATAWRVFNQAIEQLIAKHDVDHFTLRYEDMAADWSRQRDRLLEWTGIDGLKQENPLNFSPHSVSGNPCRFGSGAIRIVADERWRGDQSRFESLMVRVFCGSMQKRYRYLD